MLRIRKNGVRFFNEVQFLGDTHTPRTTKKSTFSVLCYVLTRAYTDTSQIQAKAFHFLCGLCIQMTLTRIDFHTETKNKHQSG